MARYIRYKYQKQQINFLNCDELNKWIDTCQTRVVGFDSVCSSSCNCAEYGDFEDITAINTIAFRYTGDIMTYRLNDTTYTATTNPYFKTLEELGIETLTSCNGTFNGNRELTNLLTFPDTSNVTDMEWMFYYCTRLTELDLSNFNTSNVTTMYGMFNNCSDLTELDVSNFDTSNVTTMGTMFYNCSSLTELDVSNFDTSNVTNMGTMFGNCYSLTELNVSNFNTENVTSFRSTFNGCSGLTELDLSNFNTSNVTDVSFAFSRCINLQSLNVSSWDVNHITNDNSVSIFTSTCTSLTSLTVKSGTEDWWYARLVDAGIEDNVTITYNIIN